MKERLLEVSRPRSQVIPWGNYASGFGPRYAWLCECGMVTDFGALRPEDVNPACAAHFGYCSALWKPEQGQCCYG